MTIYDRVAALSAVAGDEYTVQLLLNEFLRILPESEAALRTAHDAMDYPAMFNAAHKLAGSAGAIGAPAIQAAASSLQYALNHKPLQSTQINADISVLLDQIARFQQRFSLGVECG